MWARVAAAGRPPAAAGLDRHRAGAARRWPLGITQLSAHGIPQTESFSTQVDSKTGQELIAAHFPAGTGSPAADHRASRQPGRGRRRRAGVPGVAAVAPYTGAPPYRRRRRRPRWSTGWSGST